MFVWILTYSHGMIDWSYYNVCSYTVTMHGSVHCPHLRKELSIQHAFDKVKEETS